MPFPPGRLFKRAYWGLGTYTQNPSVGIDLVAEPIERFTSFSHPTQQFLKSLRSFPMRISDAHGERQSVLSNPPPFVEIGDPDGGISSLLRPTPSYRKGHVLQIIVGKEYAFQVVENDLDGPVGGVPYLRVVAAPGRCDVDHHNAQIRILFVVRNVFAVNEEIAPRPYDLGAISAFTANTFLTTKRIRICALW